MWQGCDDCYNIGLLSRGLPLADYGSFFFCLWMKVGCHWKIILTPQSVEDIDKIGLGWGRSTTFIIYS